VSAQAFAGFLADEVEEEHEDEEAADQEEAGVELREEEEVAGGEEQAAGGDQRPTPFVQAEQAEDAGGEQGAEGQDALLRGAQAKCAVQPGVDVGRGHDDHEEADGCDTGQHLTLCTDAFFAVAAQAPPLSFN